MKKFTTQFASITPSVNIPGAEAFPISQMVPEARGNFYVRFNDIYVTVLPGSVQIIHPGEKVYIVVWSRGHNHVPGDAVILTYDEIFKELEPFMTDPDRSKARF